MPNGRHLDFGRTYREFEPVKNRLALRDEAELDLQLLSPAIPAWHDPGPESVEITRRTNDAIAIAVARHPAGLQVMAILHASMPEEAAFERERWVTAPGFKDATPCGRMGTRTPDQAILAGPRLYGTPA